MTTGAVAQPPSLLSFSNQTFQAGVASSHLTSGFVQFQYAGGGAIGDFNRDGHMDFIMLSGGNNNIPDRLFINNGDGTFTNRSAEWGITGPHRGKSVAVGDYNNDGWPDIFITSAGPIGQVFGPGHHRLYRNNGNGTFTEVAAQAGVAFADPTGESAWTCAFGDYDLDGHLDLFVGGFRFPASNTPNRLFRNNGDGTFTDVTEAISLFNGVGPVAALSARFADMDGDGYPELLLGGDFKGVSGFIGSRYFRNNGNGTFTDVTDASGTGDEENGMGQALLDIDNDGRLDWHVTSIYGPSFGWTGNKLYRNLGNHTFSEISGTAGTFDGGYAWGAVGVDFDHDGWEDIAEVGGDAQPNSPFYNIPARLWLNNGNGTFTESAAATNFNFVQKGRALLRFDYDNDGDQDVLIFRFNGVLTLLRNDLQHGPTTAWLRVFLDPKGAPGIAPDGIGAMVRVVTNGVTRVRMIDAGASFLGTSEFSAHFGLGSAAVAEEVTVRWPTGAETTLTNVALNRTITIAPSGLLCAADLNHNGMIDGADLAIVLGAWGSTGMPGIPGDVNRDGQVNGADIAQVLGGWGPCQ
ncbi:MAG: VCBS repeat-containing protein [Phycisphaeraceae bacterium]|nr:VCBS repeat-containing protein [Phycisphaeraceae bacterium]